ncbi:tripartite tricarboxylate transporter TctB family protein [Salibacterium salarium]|uniref:Tripartite tricarboxylate transporter TctB family protein n=1 Tax=Salibacterium salarium TaxID=284579 RepID=A0A428N126_9BACI|nr:tripartite tricarboxylate transporter TctB family protein [Salibacterium salarium]RSL32155.1 tripartite tricarboxylate transporter TctB family protein [Salibacterium salarium]
MMNLLKSSKSGILMTAFSLLVLSQAIVMEDQAITDPSSGSFFPALISVIMLAAGIFTIFQERLSRRSSPQHDSVEQVDAKADNVNTDIENETSSAFTKKDYSLILLYFCMVIVFVLLLPVLSFFPAAFLFLIGSMWYLRGVSLVLNIIISIITIIVIYFLFSELFNIVFP